MLINRYIIISFLCIQHLRAKRPYCLFTAECALADVGWV